MYHAIITEKSVKLSKGYAAAAQEGWGGQTSVVRQEDGKAGGGGKEYSNLVALTEKHLHWVFAE